VLEEISRGDIRPAPGQGGTGGSGRADSE
jgi:hypothetical protein